MLLALMTSVVLAAPVSYTLDASQSQLVAVTTPEGLLAAASHEHVIEARVASGELVYDAEAPEHSSVTVTVQAMMLINDDPATIARLKLRNNLNDADREKVARNLRSAEQLDVSKFSTITFSSTRVKPLGDGRLEVTGKLTLHGVGLELTLPVSVAVSGGQLVGQGTLVIKQSNFGIKPFSIGLGTVKNADPVTLQLKLVAKAK